MSRKAVWTLLAALIGLIWLGAPLPAWADSRWWDPRDCPPPDLPGYRERVYTRQHWTDFWVDESGGRRQRGAVHLLFTGYASVYDLPGDLSQGYTAIGQNDGAWPGAWIYLGPMGVPFVDGYYIVSPAFWREHPPEFALAPVFTGAGDRIADVTVTCVRDDSDLTGDDTFDNPKCFDNERGFHAGGFDAWGNGYHWWAGDRSPIRATGEFASMIGRAAKPAGGAAGEAFTTRAELWYTYVYGLTVNQDLTCLGRSGDRETWRVSVENTTPYAAKEVTLRAYLVREDGTYELAASVTTDIGPVAYGDGRGGILPARRVWRLADGVTRIDGAGRQYDSLVAWTFDVPVVTGEYRVLVTANVRLDERGGAEPEPLKTAAVYGQSGASSITPITGTKMEVAPKAIRSAAPVALPDAYGDNWALSGERTGETVTVPEEEPEPQVIYGDWKDLTEVHPATYHPLKLTPVYEDVVTEKDLLTWTEVPIDIPPEGSGRVRARLVR